MNKAHVQLYLTKSIHNHNKVTYMNYIKQLNGPNVVGITWEDNVTIRILTSKR